MDPDWNEDLPWMVSVEGGTGMLCSVLQALSTPQKNQLLGKLYGLMCHVI